MPIEGLVPEPVEQSRLVAAMGKLCAERGWERLVCGPIFEPVAEHFPDRIAGTVGGVRRLLLRLLAYAELADVDVEVALFDSDDPFEETMADGTVWRMPDHTAAWFAGITDGVCRFGLDIRQAANAEHLVGILAHEVAHAYRHEHGLVLMDRDLEELATDLTTVYLGFGLFTVNNTYRYRSMGFTEGYATYHAWSEQSAGYLRPEAMSFLLAVQAACRGSDSERRALANHLEVNQRAMFEAAYRTLDVDQLRMELGVPPPHEWPDRISADTIGQTVQVDPTPHDDDHVFLVPSTPTDSSPGTRPDVDEREEEPLEVHRVPQRNGLGGAILGGIAVLALGSMTGVDDPMEYWSMALAVVAAGYVAGHAIVMGRCSNPRCRADLEEHHARCRGCGGRVAGFDGSLHPDDEEDFEEDDDDFEEDYDEDLDEVQ